MTVPVFDAFCGFGGAVAGDRVCVSADELADECERIGIDRALARIAPESMDFDVADSNRRLFVECRSHACLTPCPVVIPNGAGDYISEKDQLDEAVRESAAAVWIRPGPDGWNADLHWCCDRLFDALSERRMPVVCLERLVGTATVARIAEAWPSLPIIHADLNYRMLRTEIPLLERFDNVHACVSTSFCAHRGLERLVERVGAGRLVLGSNFPLSEPLPAVTYVMYADITEADKAMIASGTMDRLIEGIRT